jgi:hypothetical protein
VATSEQKISKEDLESKFVELQDGIENAALSARDLGKKIGIVAAVVLIIIVFMLGRRRGKLAKTVVEIRRF